VQELDEIRKQIIMLKERVRKTLLVNENVTSPLRDANLIDSIQRLGLYHHFEHEIGELLQQIHNNYVENGTITLNEDLYSIALVFRLLRQQGYHILPGIVNDLTLKGFLYKD
jgi:(-)-germacrene D synthase